MLKNAHIINYKRIKNSKNGNPKYEIVATDGYHTIVGVTASDSMIGYTLTNYIEKESVNIKYHITKNNTIIDDISFPADF